MLRLALSEIEGLAQHKSFVLSVFFGRGEEKHAEPFDCAQGKLSRSIKHAIIQNMWYLYILETQDGSFYTGTTNDIERRMAEHKDGKGGHFTRSFKFKGLLYTEEHPTKSAALKREKQVQSWTRREKSALIKGDLKQPKAL